MKELITVIVPIHNVEEYLTECLESIVSQTYTNLEIILVDDCSTDNSSVICDQYAEKDARVQVIHRSEQGGEGGAKARNDGIAAATGALLYFIDSDDYIEKDMLAKMVELMKREESDCVVSSFHYVNSIQEELTWHTPQLSEYHVMSGREAAGIFLTTLNIEGFSWNKLIRKEILMNHDIRFDESKNSFVDMYGMFRVILYSSKVSFYDAKPYYYRQHNVSCVHTMSMRKLANFKQVTLQIMKLGIEQNLQEEGYFFYRYRMLLQLYDAVKAKKTYAGLWKQLKKEYNWKYIFGIPLSEMYFTLLPYVKKDRMKTAIKALIVWFNFR